MKPLIPQTYPEMLSALATMGEWMAYGFYEAIEQPWPAAYGRAFRRLYEQMEINIPPSGLLLPHDPFPSQRTEATHQAHHATGFLCDFMHSCGIHINEELVAEKKLAFPQHAALIDDLVADLRGRTMHFGGYTHSNPDIRRVVGEGFDAIEAELDDQRAAAEQDGTDEERNLLAALKEYAVGVRAFHSRSLRAIRQAAEDAQGKRREDLLWVADAFERAFLRPATTFVEGMLAVHFAWLLDGCDSIGRVDQVLGPLFDRDMSLGTLSIDLARSLIDELFGQMERLNGWNMQVGGYRPNGEDGYCALTLEFILACGRNKFRRPNLAFRITPDTPTEGLITAIDVLRQGAGRPALYHDALYVQSLLSLDLGLTAEDAREIGFGGCTETMIAGLSNVGSLEGDLNLAKALELALWDGWDPLLCRQAGPHTGRFEDFPSFDEFLAAVKRQIQYQTDAFVARNQKDLRRRFTEGDPKLYRTLFTRDCVQRRRSFEAGGARYNWCVVNYPGIANLIDSLAAVRKLVFEEGRISPGELLAALQANFNGFESVHRWLAAAPKFGNDNAAVDTLGSEVLRYAWQELHSHETPRGGRYLPACILFATYGMFGAQVGALPDGRWAGSVLADSTGPAQGRDTHGPTAMLSSVAKLPLSLAVGTPVLNIRFQKAFLADRAGQEACAHLVRTFFEMGGMQIQLSVLSKEEMLAAQAEPEKYGDLIVRIGGYSEYFVRLDAALQNSVIERTEYQL